MTHEPDYDRWIQDETRFQYGAYDEPEPGDPYDLCRVCQTPIVNAYELTALREDLQPFGGDLSCVRCRRTFCSPECEQAAHETLPDLDQPEDDIAF